MNLLFQTWKPRRFHHEPIYRDERAERLAQVERRARAELGMDDECGEHTAHRPISFATDRQQRHRARRGLVSSGLGMALLLVLLFVLLLIMML